MYKFKFADIGEGLHEGVVGEVSFKVGDKVNEGDSLFTVETDKVNSEIPSPVSGTIVKVLVKEGETVTVGDDTFHIDDGSADTAEAAPVAEEAPAEADADAGASVVGDIKSSNKLFNLNRFGTAAPKPAAAAPAAKAESKGVTFTGAIEKEYDLIVIGAGPGGYLAAEEASKQGLKTLIIEKEFWGGVCLNVGCIPTKALLKSAEIFEYIQHAEDFGIDMKTSKLELNWDKMHERKASVVKKLTDGVQMLMKMNKVDMIFGEAKFVGTHSLEVAGKNYKGKNVIIATGSSARNLPIDGFAEAFEAGHLLTSKEAINLENKPKSITIIGGGVIGVEFAQVFAVAGVKVTLVQNLGNILDNLDKDVIRQVTADIKELGVELITNANIKGLKNEVLTVEVNGETQEIKSDKIMVSVGRAPLSLGIDGVGIELGQRKEVVVDNHNRTNISGVYAIGDVTGQAMLAHVAYKHAVIAVNAITGARINEVKQNEIPACIYTHPEVAAIGMTEQEAKASGAQYVVAKYNMSVIGKAVAGNSPKGFAKFIVGKAHGEILGCHIVGNGATDMIAEVATALNLEATIFEIADTIHPHPTYSEILWEAARVAVHKLQH